MAFEIQGMDLGHMTATADYSSTTAQYTCVLSTAQADFSQQSVAGERVLGVLQNQPSSGQMGSIRVSGVTKVWVHTTSAAVAAGDALQGSTSGGVLPVANALSSYVIGRALEASSTNHLIAMLITHEGGGSTATT